MRGDVTEADFQKVIIEFAKLRGWKVHHTRPALRQSGRYSTPIQGDKGFPDLTLARGGVVIFAELKSKGGRLTDDQKAWGHAINHLGSQWCRWYCWRPDDWEQIREELM